jgi:predicted amidohydrolase
MARKIKIAAAQMGATHRTDESSKTLERMLKLLDEAASEGAELVLFPETGFTTVGTPRMSRITKSWRSGS